MGVTLVSGHEHQVVTQNWNTTANVFDWSATFTPSSGNCLVLHIAAGARESGYVQTTPAGWTLVDSEEYSGTFGSLSGWTYLKENCSSSDTSASATTGGGATAQYLSWIVREYTGGKTSGIINANSHTDNAANVATASTSCSTGTTGTLSQANGLGIAAAMIDLCENFNGIGTWSGSWSEVASVIRATGGRPGIRIAELAVSATTPQSATLSGFTSDQNYGAIVVLYEAAGGTVSVNQTTETDTAQPVGKAKYKAIGQASTTDATQAITAARRIAVGQSSETDAAQAIAPRKVLALGQVAETDTAQSITAAGAITAAVGQVAETDLAQAVASSKLKAIGQASEADSAQAVAARKVKVIGQAAETDNVQAFSASKTVALGQATETDTAQAIAHLGTKTIAVGLVTETDFAQAVAAYKRLGILQPVETDSAHSISVVKRVGIGQVSETDTAQSIAVSGGTAPAVLSAPRSTYSNTQTAGRQNVQSASRRNTQTARRPHA